MRDAPAGELGGQISDVAQGRVDPVILLTLHIDQRGIGIVIVIQHMGKTRLTIHPRQARLVAQGSDSA